jgi:hypothetical protein
VEDDEGFEKIFGGKGLDPKFGANSDVEET